MASCKRGTEIADVCVFCENEDETSDQKLSSASVVGKEKIIKLLPVLKKKKSERRLSDRLSAIEDEQACVKYHKNCYRAFIRRNDAEERDTSFHQRACRDPVDWTACIFCQERKWKTELHVVTSSHMAQRIQYGCETHPSMSRRVPPYLDIIATGVKYHNVCYVGFLRESWNTGLRSEASAAAPSSDDALEVLADELLTDAIDLELSLDSAYQRYLDICTGLGVNVPNSYASRKQTFLDALKSKLRDTHDVSAVRGLGTLLTVTPMKQTQQIPNDAEEEDDISEDLSRLARRIRQDIKNTPSYEGLHGDEQSAVACVPAVLLSFIRQLLDSDCSGDGDGAGRQALSIAQDVVFCASKGRKWTPKHVGLANAVHQETRSKRLVQMLHSAGHCISYKQLLTVTTGLAEAVLCSADAATGATVPPNLVPGKFVHFAVDNIDILDESLDGKDTFHATQVRCCILLNSTIISYKYKHVVLMKLTVLI